MIKKITKHDIEHILKYPQYYVDENTKEDLVCVNDTTISLARRGSYYFIVKYSDTDEIKIEYLNNSLSGAYKDILDKCIPAESLSNKKSSNKGSNIRFTIETLNDNGSGMKYASKSEVLREISMMIDDCQKNGGTFMDFQVDSDASCFDVT